MSFCEPKHVFIVLWINSFDNNVVVDILLSTLYAAVHWHCTDIQKSKWVSKIDKFNHPIYWLLSKMFTYLKCSHMFLKQSINIEIFI